MPNKSRRLRKSPGGFFDYNEYDDHFFSSKRAQQVPAPRKSMQLSNKQLKLLLPVIKRELEADLNNVEWRDLYDRLIKQVGWRISKPGGQELQDLLRDDFQPPPPQVWGRDYE